MMSFTTILSVIRCDHADSDLRAAVELSRSSGAHLSVVLLAIAAPPPLGEYAEHVSVAWLEERDADRSKLAERSTKIKDLLQEAEVPHDIVDIYTEWTYVDNVVARQARYADLLVIGPELAADSPLKSAVVDGALFHSSVPVLIIPRNAIPTLKPHSVVLAWNDTPEAAKAAKQGLEFLKAASKVHGGMVDPEPGIEQPGAEIGIYLARHGVNFSADVLRSDGRTVAETLKQYADDVAADMIVMGAYGHSRMRERIFGGVTRSMLEHPSRPVFLAR
ncbi:universal stress protein [Neorhizobium sp. Rsf11]|uniref:Universal stress protein n=1 Tax=Neorhizobium phenanthreniclasticum TaxID=3157917 RepID=A0ABV0M503_9HYPH